MTVKVLRKKVNKRNKTMAINYTYPVKGSPVTADEFLIIDSVDNSTKKVTTSSVLSLVTTPATSWGTITGTLSTQTDLQTALNSKESTAGARYIPSTVISVQADETINLSDSEYDDVFMILLTWAGESPGTMTLNLPTAGGANANRTIRIISDSTFEASGSHKTNVTPTGGENLDGGTDAFLINRGYEGLKIWSNGTEWFIIQQKA